jgi:hypothetical protein
MQSRIQFTVTTSGAAWSVVDINRKTRWYACYRYDYLSDSQKAARAAAA